MTPTTNGSVPLDRVTTFLRTMPLVGAGLLAFAVVLITGAADAQYEHRYAVDGGDVAGVRSEHPGAAAKLAKGEALLSHGPTRADIEQAAKLFAEAEAEAPHSTVLARRSCQVLAALGHHRDALRACGRAMGNDMHSALNMRATVGALMAGPEPPTVVETGYAAIHAQHVRELMPNEPWSAAAECDIAIKLGDTEMLNRCVRELKEKAPTYYETPRMERILDSIRPGWKVACGWIGLALLCIGTLVHAAMSRRRMVATGAAALAFRELDRRGPGRRG
jgi:hypothetical protein